jgi:deoxyhypusine synthase
MDSTVALPILTSYALAKVRPRPLRRLYDKRVLLVDALYEEYMRVKQRMRYPKRK